MNIKRLITGAAALIMALMPAIAQNGTMSPYSRYGYGHLRDNATSAQRAMGGVGYAMNSGRQINVMNPASYAAIDSLTFLFDMGIDFTSLWLNENGHNEQDFGGGLDYITMQVPITKWLGASLGVLPYSSVGYSFGSEIENGKASRNGSGSLNELYLGVGANPFRNFYLGANISYLFGNIVNDVYVSTISGSSSLFERSMEVRDWHLDLGLQYAININARNRLTLGAVYSPKKDLHGHVYGVYYDATGSGSSSSTQIDTINAGDTKMAGRYSIPASYGVGLNWNHARKLMAEVDFTYQPWKDAKFGQLEGFETTRFADRWRIAAGAQYTPALRGGYFRTVQYRLGASYNRDYIMVRDNNVRDFTLSFGFGFPVPSFKTIVNLGFEWRNRQTTPVKLVRENYFNITLAINFNEMWFRKNKLY